MSLINLLKSSVDWLLCVTAPALPSADHNGRWAGTRQQNVPDFGWNALCWFWKYGWMGSTSNVTMETGKQRDISTVLFPCFFHKHISNQRCFAPTHLRPRMLLQVFFNCCCFLQLWINEQTGVQRPCPRGMPTKPQQPGVQHLTWVMKNKCEWKQRSRSTHRYCHLYQPLNPSP